MPLHKHEALELVYYIDGMGRSKVGNRQHDVRKNIFTITPRGVGHDQENLTDLRSICLGIRGSGLEPLQGAWLDSGGILDQGLRNIVLEFENKRVAYDLICQGILYEIVGQARRIALENIRPRGRNALAVKAMDIIRKKEGNLSVVGLAEQLFVSADYLRHIFHEYSTQSPLQLILKMRLAKAKTLLAGGAFSVKETAEKCGFGSQYYFSRFFRKYAGVTPSQYLASLGRVCKRGQHHISPQAKSDRK